MQDDTDLQEKLMKLMQYFSKATLWKWCQMIFADDTCGVWDSILIVFALGVQLCLQVATHLYDIIVNTICAAVTKWAGDWLLKNGGWVALVVGDGMSAVKMILLSWMDWLMPSAGSNPKDRASAPKGGASAPKGGASAPKDEIKLD